jgi:hypothetical protein
MQERTSGNVPPMVELAPQHHRVGLYENHFIKCFGSMFGFRPPFTVAQFGISELSVSGTRTVGTKIGHAISEREEVHKCGNFLNGLQVGTGGRSSPP